MAKIKVKAFAVLVDHTRSRHVVWRSRDETKEPSSFHRLLGGHVEFGEGSATAVRREICEELGIELAEVALLGVLENVFEYACRPGHEVVFVYGATIPDGVVPDGGGWFDDGGPIWVEWRPVTTATDLPLYPAGTQRLLDNWLRTERQARR